MSENAKLRSRLASLEQIAEEMGKTLKEYDKTDGEWDAKTVLEWWMEEDCCGNAARKTLATYEAWLSTHREKG